MEQHDYFVLLNQTLFDMLQRKGTIIKQSDKSWTVKIKALNTVVSLPKSCCSIYNRKVNNMTGYEQVTFDIPKWLWDKLIT